MKAMRREPVSIWAFLVYIALIAAAFFLYRRRMIERQRNQFERKSMEDSMKKTKELNELKLNFFTNVSHELRTAHQSLLAMLIGKTSRQHHEWNGRSCKGWH